MMLCFQWSTINMQLKSKFKHADGVDMNHNPQLPICPRTECFALQHAAWSPHLSPCVAGWSHTHRNILISKLSDASWPQSCFPTLGTGQGGTTAMPTAGPATMKHRLKGRALRKCACCIKTTLQKNPQYKEKLTESHNQTPSKADPEDVKHPVHWLAEAMLDTQM